MPESRFKYLYERLGDHEFQLLANALLTAQYPDYRPLPLRQSDGGRDGITRGRDRDLVFQVKWSVHGREKKAVAWLDSAVTGEADNIKRLVAEGVRHYTLVTNVPSTGMPGTGTFDQLNDRLDQHAKDYGLETMECHWRESIDAMVDNADDALLWKYAEMLAGWELMRYLIAEDRAGHQNVGLRKLVRKVAAVQWDEDERVKFSQVDIDREKVADLFVDVDADQLSAWNGPDPGIVVQEPVGGAARYLLKADIPERSRWNTIVRGAPGQGKSTLSQYIAQVHRSAFVSEDLRPALFPDIARPLFPIRVDLSDYGRWISGIDIFDTESDTQKRGKKRPAASCGLEHFLADVMTDAGGSTITADGVQDLLDLIPSLVILDGLDEVGRPAMRAQVVTEIDKFAIRGRTYDIPPRIVVTTRPSTNELPEPSPDHFEVIVLSPLTADQRADYLRKWSAVRGIFGAAGRRLRTAYKAKIAEPYLEELAGNPMQLTILLDLLHKHGEATPDQRTTLYDAYVDMLLMREANKHPDTVRKHQLELRSIIPFLGWHLHAHNEADRLNSSMSVADLKASIRHYQRTHGNRENIVDELFEAASDRLWALTSKVDGTYEFEVLSLREYFAANFLFKFAGEEIRGFDRGTVLRELLRRPYWLNTARFYGGNAEGTSELAVLADAIIDELADDPPQHAIIAVWTLLTDGVFSSRPRRGREVLEAVCSDRHMHVLVNALTRREIRPLPALPQPTDTGPDPTWERLTRRLETNPAHPSARLDMRVLRELLNQKTQFASWWTGQVVASMADPGRLTAWLKMGALCEAAMGLTVDLTGVDLTRPGLAQNILDSGVVPPRNGEFERALMEAVLDGRCPSVTSVKSLPAQVAIAFAPQDFIASSERGFPEHTDGQRRRRQEALKRLRRDHQALAAASAKRKFGRGQKRSTFPWANTATALFDEMGPSWAATQIAILGAASPMHLGLQRQPDKDAFGPNSHPAALLELTRQNEGDVGWWRAEHDRLAIDTAVDAAVRDRALAEWCLALWCVAKTQVVTELFDLWSDTFTHLPEHRRATVVDCAARCSVAGYVAKLSLDLHSPDEQVSILLGYRSSTPRPRLREEGHPRRDSVHDRPPAQNPPLIDVARANKWFKVDEEGAYR
jgi:hypothetical protein